MRSALLNDELSELYWKSPMVEERVEPRAPSWRGRSFGGSA